MASLVGDYMSWPLLPLEDDFRSFPNSSFDDRILIEYYNGYGTKRDGSLRCDTSEIFVG
jgi:hypothetical protein